ncbi:hybrid sensor histidine kinase/response regulator [Nostoc sp. UCD121]|uniref:hybrid sensor histidine kinase/response regulator n=1 Tax=unclassified Nostoc TaxID=2593658 RepID=UPI001625ECB0|nr:MULTISPECIES: hybrid sensor histidine kinase/response regulator [unclassified Nostoc]MBC1224721.1 hybrid sensor histidine kinase/response regulator [Nostoc sp. UCD120]MBC1280007.1 hybrid sensor histidine kinase/response regulator [Nostoc sp. UCD121]MBC1298499.1 hybrid sensor histidine kinase/response regulator [Nostoc sp. UCD122]
MSLTKSVKKDKILAVDDVFDNLLVLEAVLEDEGYEISLVEDSKIALAMVEESPPDIILLDVMMPEIDGYEFTRRIRQNPALPFIPILLLTAHYQSSVVEGLDAGADDFIRKPFDPDELHARVRSLLRLKHSIDERDQMANLRADFVSRFTHDLRIPLVASNRVLKLLLEGRFCEVSPQLEEIIDTMIGSNQDLLEMVNTLLEVYRHEAGCKTLKIAPCNIEELVSEVSQELTPLAEEKGLVVNIERDETASTVMGDRLELRRVLTNIIGNAIKFADKGSVDIHCHLTPEDVTIDIQDTGPGISKQDQAILFERFRQGKHQRSGSGLGLYLSRCIIEAHQGTIDVISEPGQGSTFTIRLPVAADN